MRGRAVNVAAMAGKGARRPPGMKLHWNTYAGFKRLQVSNDCRFQTIAGFKRLQVSNDCLNHTPKFRPCANDGQGKVEPRRVQYCERSPYWEWRAFSGRPGNRGQSLTP